MEDGEIGAVLLADGWLAIQRGSYKRLSKGLSFTAANGAEVECRNPDAAIAVASEVPTSDPPKGVNH